MASTQLEFGEFSSYEEFDFTTCMAQMDRDRDQYQGNIVTTVRKDMRYDGYQDELHDQRLFEIETLTAITSDGVIVTMVEDSGESIMV